MDRRDLSKDMTAARGNLDLASATLSVVVLADSALEHYRGGFYNRVMFAAPLLSSMTLASSLAARQRSAATPAHLLAVAGRRDRHGLSFPQHHQTRRPAE